MNETTQAILGLLDAGCRVSFRRRRKLSAVEVVIENEDGEVLAMAVSRNEIDLMKIDPLPAILHKMQRDIS